MNEPVHASLLADYYPTHTHGKVFSFHRQGNPIGLILALGGGLLADVVGWRGTFIVLAIPTLLVIGFISRLPHPTRGAQIDLDLALAAEAKAQKVPLGEGWRRLKAIPTLKRTWLGQRSSSAPRVVPITSFISFFYENVYDIDTNFGRSAILTFFGFGSIIGINVGARYATRALAGLDLPKLSVYGGRSLMAGAACLVGMALAPWLGLSMLFLFLVGVVSVGFTSYNLPLVAAITPPRLRSQAFAYFVFFFGLGAIVIAGFASGIAEDHGYRQGLAILAFFEALAGPRLPHLQALRHEGRGDRPHHPHGRGRAQRRVDGRRQRRHPHLPQGRGRLRPGPGALRGRHGGQAGEIVALLGTNGAGKSTLLKAISGIVDPIGGAIFFDGRDITHADGRQTAELGIVAGAGRQGRVPDPHGRRAPPRRGRGSTATTPRPAQANEEVYEIFPRLRERIDQLAGNLSGGEQQMLALGMAFIAKPKLLMIDELSLGLAPTIVEQLLGIVRRIQASGTAIILVEQSINVALTVAERAYFLEKGEVRFEGPTAELLERDDIVRSVFLAGRRPRRGRGAERERHRDGRAGATAPARRRAGAPRGRRRRPSASAASAPSTTRRSRCARARSSASSAPTAPARRRSSTSSPASSSPDGGRVALRRHRRHRAAPGPAGLARPRPLVPGRPPRPVAHRRREPGARARAPHRGARPPRLVPRPARPCARSRTTWRGRSQDLIELMSLGAFRDKFVRELSTGSRRIVDLAMCIAHDPKVLLLDEPSSGIAQTGDRGARPAARSASSAETGCAPAGDRARHAADHRRSPTA